MSELFPWVLSIVSIFLTYKWQSANRENEQLKNKLNTKKEELYTEFITFYMDLIKNPKDELATDKMRDLNKKMILVGSNKVLLTFGDFMQIIYKTGGKDATTMLRLLGELMIAMREDLGHSDWQNTTYWYDTVRPWMTDIDKVINLKSEHRRVYNNLHNPKKFIGN